MKKWTVMLIPHDRGESRTLNLSAYQIWLVVALLVVLSFTTSFFFKRHQTFVREVVRLRQAKRDLEIACANQVSSQTRTASSAQERIEIEKRIRAEYEASVARIAAELTELRDMEAEARNLTGLAPRSEAKDAAGSVLGSGKGGGSDGLADTAYEQDEEMAAPPGVIYGLSRPSADLMFQEINVRRGSLQGLVVDLRDREEQLRRLPSIWPVSSQRHRITSSFGYRKDPFTYRIRHHSGTDISAPYGSPIVATAKGTVVYSDYDGQLGHVVKIDHGNGMETWYAHLSSRLVKVGDSVERKDVIGKLGSSGRSTGPHLHYEVHIKGKPMDAAKYLRD